jgi:hypothetical protein
VDWGTGIDDICAGLIVHRMADLTPVSEPQEGPTDIVVSLDRSPVQPCPSCGATTNAWPMVEPPEVHARVPGKDVFPDIKKEDISMSLRVRHVNGGE